MNWINLVTVILIAGTMATKAVVPGGSNDTDCNQLLQSAYQNMSLETSLNKQKITSAVYINYKVTTSYTDDLPETSADIKAYVSKHGLCVESPVMNLYRDKKHAVMIMPREKIIYVTNVEKQKPPDEEFLDNWDMDLSKLVNVKLVPGCEVRNNGRFRGVRLNLTEEGTKRYQGVESIEYHLSKDRDWVEEMIMNYSSKANNEIASVLYEFIEIDKDHFTEKLKVSPIDRVFKGKKLLPKWQGWELIDNRPGKIE